MHDLVAMPTWLSFFHMRKIQRIAETTDPFEGDWCGCVSDRAAEFLNKHGVKATLYPGAPFAEPVPFGGCYVDDSHSYVVLRDGTILDATVKQFVGPPGKPSRKQVRVARGWPHVSGFPDIAVVPLGHPYVRQMGYESHLTGDGWIHKPSWLVHAVNAR